MFVRNYQMYKSCPKTLIEHTLVSFSIERSVQGCIIDVHINEIKLYCNLQQFSAIHKYGQAYS